MTMTKGTSNWLAAGCLMCAVGTWASPVPSGAMADYHLQCGWGPTYSEAGCAALADRLEAVVDPSRDERLALVLSRRTGALGEFCPGLRDIVADHPDYADALWRLGSYCADGREEVQLVRRALEIEPDNYDALSDLLISIDHFLPAELVHEIDPDTIAAYREARYEAAKEREAWQLAAAAAASKDVEPWGLRAEMFAAATGLVAAALREGDLDGAAAVRARVRRDAGLDELDYSVAENVVLACQTVFVLGELCASAIERSAEHAAAAGLPIPGTVLAVVGEATESLRRFACAESTGGSPFGMLVLHPGECEGAEATESDPVRRLRAVLEHHGGPWSSEHHRVHAQGFLGGEHRIDGLREALRLDTGNDRARCELATALAGRGDAEGAAALGGDPECLELGDFAWGDVGSLRPEPGLSAD